MSENSPMLSVLLLIGLALPCLSKVAFAEAPAKSQLVGTWEIQHVFVVARPDGGETTFLRKPGGITHLEIRDGLLVFLSDGGANKDYSETISFASAEDHLELHREGVRTLYLANGSTIEIPLARSTVKATVDKNGMLLLVFSPQQDDSPMNVLQPRQGLWILTRERGK